MNGAVPGAAGKAGPAVSLNQIQDVRKMGRPKVYIDGREGTTGLQIYDRLAAREDVELLLIDEAKRKDPAERRKFLNEADLVFLCLPDAAAI